MSADARLGTPNLHSPIFSREIVKNKTEDFKIYLKFLGGFFWFNISKLNRLDSDNYSFCPGT